MEKARILEFYKLDEQAYQDTCSTIGLKNPKELSGAQLHEFDRIRGWLDAGEVKNFSDAKKRLKAEKEAKSTNGIDPAAMEADIIKQIKPAAKAKADAALASIAGAAENARQVAVQIASNAIVNEFVSHFISGLASPEFQQRFKGNSDKNRETIEAEFNEVQDEMPSLPPTQPQS